MLYVAQTALELGFQYALVAMALFLRYRVLDIADLTTDGCFVLGCAVSVTLTAAGHPFLAIPAAIGNEVFITYIGLGVPLEIPTLGNLIKAGQTVMMESTLSYQLFFPVIILSIITISFYIVGNSFADAADPKNHVK